MAHTPWPENVEWWQRSLLFSSDSSDSSVSQTPSPINMRVIDRWCIFFPEFANTAIFARDALAEIPTAHLL